MSRRLRVFCYLQHYFASFVVDLDALVVGDLRHEFACCPRLPILGSPSFVVAFVVLASWRLTHLQGLSTSWDKFCRVTHDALVAFVGEAALWLRG